MVLEDWNKDAVPTTCQYEIIKVIIMFSSSLLMLIIALIKIMEHQ